MCGLRCAEMIEFKVLGDPAAQGSKKHVGNGVMVEMSKKLRPWREAIKWAYIELCDKRPIGQSRMVRGPVAVQLFFTLKKPKNAPKRRVTYPDRTPDLDKLCRSTFDGLTQAGAWEDDARVISLLAQKCFPGEHADALDVPGCVIRITGVA